MAESNIAKLDLAFNVHFLKSRGSGVFKKVPSLASQERNVLCAIFKKVLSLVINDELGSISVRFETELFSDEAQLDVRFISVSGALAFRTLMKINIRENSTYPLQMLHRAARRSLVTNISMRYAPMLGVSRYNWKNL